MAKTNTLTTAKAYLRHKSNYLIIGLLGYLTLGLSGCNKVKPIYCDNSAVANQLLQLGKYDVSGVQFISESITSITSIRQFGDHINCSAHIKYSHNIFPDQSLEESYQYSVNTQLQINNFTASSPLAYHRYHKWLDQLPAVVAQQKTRYGNLVVLQMPQSAQRQTFNQIQQLAFNDQLLALPNGRNYSTITIDRKFTVPGSEVFLISAFYNSKNDLSSNHNYFISVESSGLSISPSFTYQDGSMQKVANIINFNGINRLAFAESNDYPIYSYQNQQLILIRKNHPLSYYQQKFSGLTATKILQQIKSDGCLNGDQFYSSDICSSKINTYCFKFSAISKPNKNKDYWLLHNMCQQAQY